MRLEKYIERFTAAYSCLIDPNEEFAIQAYIVGVTNESVQLALCGNDVTDMEGLINKAYKLSDMQEMSQNWAPRMQEYDQKRVNPNRGNRPS